MSNALRLPESGIILKSAWKFTKGVKAFIMIYNFSEYSNKSTSLLLNMFELAQKLRAGLGGDQILALFVLIELEEHGDAGG